MRTRSGKTYGCGAKQRPRITPTMLRTRKRTLKKIPKTIPQLVAAISKSVKEKRSSKALLAYLHVTNGMKYYLVKILLVVLRHGTVSETLYT